MNIKQFFALLVIAFCAMMLTTYGATAMPIVIVTVFCAMAVIAGPGAILRGQLGAAPDTNDVTQELNLDEILDSAIKAFKRTILPLTMFATTFRNVQLRGTDKVEVPYYPLQGITSKDFSGTYDFSTGAGSKTDTREIIVNKRKYQTLRITGYELARLPMLNAERLGQMKGEKLAYDVIQDILSVVTAANFGAAIFTGAASTFNSDDVVDLRTAAGKNAAGLLSVTDGVTNSTTTLTSATANFIDSDIGVGISGDGIPANTTIKSITSATSIILSSAATTTANGVTLALARPLTPWPETGRGLLVTPDYDGALLKDNIFSQAYSIGTAQAIQEGRLPRVFGFDYGQTAAIPSNGENLVGMAAYMSAILAAFSPIEPPPAARKIMTRYDILTDPDSEISIEYREWGDPTGDADNRVLECNYGYAPGEKLALKRLVSA